MDPDSEYQYDDSTNQHAASRHTQFLDLTNGEGGERQDMYDDDDLSDNGGGEDIPNPSNRRYDPTTPGRVVETGQEHTGRWTKEEHEAFLSALHMYGKEWKKVAAKVKTRTVVQTRTHAQKYFQKLAKAMESGKTDVSDVEMGVASEARRVAQKKKSRTPGSGSKGPRQNSSVASVAHLITNLASTAAEKTPPANAAHLSPATSSAPSIAFSKPPIPSVSRKKPNNVFPARHGFSTATTSEPFPPQYNVAPPEAPHSSSLLSSAPAAFPMKIVAPDHDAASKRGKFPEPSPAACGKRKLAEIAAARMLAGVLSGNDKHGKSLLSSAMDDGTATPPPEEDSLTNTNELPVPPMTAHTVETTMSSRKPIGLSLQIVNPETLGVSYEQQQKRRKDGGSPQTPWEGELDALISEEKKKGPPGTDSNDLRRTPEMDGFGSASSPHAVCGPGSAYGRNPLHKAVCEMDLSTLQSELSSVPPDFLQRRDEAGYCPIHSACSLCLKRQENSTIATDIVHMLTSVGADVSVCDAEGNTPLHWAARAGDKGTAEFLLLKNSPKDAKNDRGETPLHWALRAGRDGMAVATVLLENGAFPSVWSKDFKRPIDVAADGYHDEEGSIMELRKLINQRKRLSKEQRKVLKDAAEERKEARANFLRSSAQSRTLVLHHPECLEHIPKAASDWECPDRVVSILDRLRGPHTKVPPIYEHEITISQEFDRAKLDLLSRVHSTEYLKFVNELSKDLERQHKERNGSSKEKTEDSGGASKPPVVPFTPMVQRTMIKVAESSVKLGQHSDTSFSVGSLRAARRAAGAVQHAVDWNRNAFCVVRPPGHHAGINGLLDGGESCGFCIFNSVAAGAMHAISDERLLCERCAIVDIDVHHGNGTEEIVRKCHDPGKLFFFSIHLYDNERKGKRETKSFQYKFYPGTGDEDDVALNIINVPINPLWKEKEQSSNASNTHNTRNRARKKNQEKDDGDSSEAGTPKVSDAENEPASAKAPTSGTTSPTNATPSLNSGRLAYRQAIRDRLLPALRAFNPDLILISAGFDACKGDVGNAKHEFGGKEKMGIDLEPEDYAWTTRKVLEIADICCQGRVVSVLEGGYGRTPASGADPNQPLDKSMFSECALRHVHAMIDPYDSEARFSAAKHDV